MHVAASVFSNADRTFGDAMNKYLPVYKGQGYRHIIKWMILMSNNLRGEIFIAPKEYYEKVFNKPVKGSSYFLAGSDLPPDMVEFLNTPEDSFSRDGFIQFLK